MFSGHVYCTYLELQGTYTKTRYQQTPEDCGFENTFRTILHEEEAKWRVPRCNVPEDVEIIIQAVSSSTVPCTHFHMNSVAMRHIQATVFISDGRTNLLVRSG